MPAPTVDFDGVCFSANFEDFRVPFDPKRLFGGVDVEFTKNTSDRFMGLAVKVLSPKHQHPVCVKHLFELVGSTSGKISQIEPVDLGSEVRR
jgi:hypothetical protein